MLFTAKPTSFLIEVSGVVTSKALIASLELNENERYFQGVSTPKEDTEQDLMHTSHLEATS